MALPETVLVTFATIQSQLGTDFSFADLCQYVEQVRAKPVVFHEQPMPFRIMGLCAPLADVDLIMIRSGIDSILQFSTRLHELAHLLLNHLPQAAFDEETVTYAEFCADTPEVQGLMRRLDADEPREYEAETLAMLLMRAIVDHQQEAPRFAQQLYGPTR